MKVLVVGGGGREHALCWKIARSPLLDRLFCAPGNAGTAEVAENVDISATDIPALLNFAKENGIDLTVVGPEAPLVEGLADAFREEGLLVFGPDRKAAEIEGSKAFCRTLCRTHKIPSPPFQVFEDSKLAQAYLANRQNWPVVIKASGLAAGKGVVVVHSPEEGLKLVRQIMEEGLFGEAGKAVVIEEFLEGPELSVLAITDGQTIMPLEPAQDHKRAYEGDEGPNTGGMGAVSPVALANQRTRRQVESQILIQAVHALNREDRPYSGVLYAGLMITTAGPRLLEFNCRFGDPEAQPLMLRLKSDLLPILHATARGELEKVDPPEWDPRHAVCIVACSEGYPGSYEKGFPIEGLEDVEEGDDLVVFHAGTARDPEGPVVTSGGRVLGVTALADTLEAARKRALDALGKIHFQGMWFRRDIGKSAQLPAGRRREDPYTP